jgi:hypothetical protein
MANTMDDDAEFQVDLDILFGQSSETDLGLSFDFEKDLVQTNEAGQFVPSQFEKGAEICEFFLKGTCVRGTRCLYRHNYGDKTIGMMRTELFAVQQKN